MGWGQICSKSGEMNSEIIEAPSVKTQIKLTNELRSKCGGPMQLLGLAPLESWAHNSIVLSN